MSCLQITRGFTELTAELSVGSALAGLIVAAIGAFLLQQLWTRLNYDLYKIPLASGSIPILGKTASLPTTTCLENYICVQISWIPL
jgi:hypothetical protein